MKGKNRERKNEFGKYFRVEHGCTIGQALHAKGIELTSSGKIERIGK